jgi:hypothetical protein
VKYKLALPEKWVKKVAQLQEFAEGVTQVSIELKDGRVFRKILILNATYIVAARGRKDLPLEIAEIRNIFQFSEDKNPAQRDGWEFWDRVDNQIPKVVK